jgi:hypothetical protein
MKLKPIIRLIITPLSLILLLSNCNYTYSMDYVSSRRAAAKRAAPKAPAASTTSLAKDEPLVAPTVTNTASPIRSTTSSSPAASIKITIPTAPIAVPAGAPKSPRATDNGATPPTRPAAAAGNISVGIVTTISDALSEIPPAAAAPFVAPDTVTGPSYADVVGHRGLASSSGIPATAAAPSAPPALTTVVVTDALPIGSRLAGALSNALGYPEVYKYHSATEERFLLGRMQRELVRRAKSDTETDIAGAIEILQEAKDRDISIGASFADNACKHLQESSRIRCTELGDQIARLNHALIDSTHTTIDNFKTNLNSLAKQIALRKQGRDLAAERAAKSRSEVIRPSSPVADYTMTDNTVAEAELIAAIKTYIAKTSYCYVPAVKAAARLAVVSRAGDEH